MGQKTLCVKRGFLFHLNLSLGSGQSAFAGGSVGWSGAPYARKVACSTHTASSGFNPQEGTSWGQMTGVSHIDVFLGPFLSPK